MSVRTLLLLDISSLVYRAIYAHPNLSHDGMLTGGVYGTLQQAISLLKRYQPVEVAACLDRPPYLRARDFEGYKAGRNRPKPELVKHAGWSVKTISNLLEIIGIPVYGESGFEADDYIAHFCLECSKRFDRIIISSNDSDLYQMLDLGNVYLINKKKLYGQAEFEEEYSLFGIDWVHVLALAGTHNGIPGIHGIGVKKATRMLRRDRREQTWKEHGKLFGAADYLIRLPHSEFYWNESNAEIDLPGAMRDCLFESEFDDRKFTRYLDVYGIEYAYWMAEAIEEYRSNVIRYLKET